MVPSGSLPEIFSTSSIDSAAFSEAVTQAINNVDKKADASIQNFDDLTLVVDRLYGEVDSVEKLLEEIDSKIDNLDPSKNEAILKALNNVATIFNATRQDVSTLNNKFEELKKQFDDFDPGVNIVPKQRSEIVFTDFWKAGDDGWDVAWIRAHDYLRDNYLKKTYDGVVRGNGPVFAGFQNTAGATAPPLVVPPNEDGAYKFSSTLFFHPKVFYDGQSFENTVFRFERSSNYLKDNHTWWGTQKNVCAAILDGLIDSDGREWDGRGITIRGIKFHTIDDEYAPIQILGYQTNLRMSNIHVANRDSTGKNQAGTGYYSPGHGIISAPIQTPVKTPWGDAVGSFHGEAKVPNTWLMDPIFDDVFVEGTDVGFWINGGAGVRMTNCGCYFSKQGFYLKNVRFSYVDGFLFNTEDVGFSWKDKTLAGIMTGRNNSIGQVSCARGPWIYDQGKVDDGATNKTPEDWGWHGQKGVNVLGIR